MIKEFGALAKETLGIVRRNPSFVLSALLFDKTACAYMIERDGAIQAGRALGLSDELIQETIKHYVETYVNYGYQMPWDLVRRVFVNQAVVQEYKKGQTT